MMINKENQRRKIEDSKKQSKTQTKKDRKRKRKFRIFKDRQRKYKTTKERRKKTTELRSARYICAGKIYSRDPSEGSQGSQGLLLKRPRKGGIHFYAGIWPCYRGGFSLCEAILTKLIQQITYRS